MAIETELKLHIAPEYIPQFRQHPLLCAATLGATQQLSNTYFDTPHQDLSNQGIGLRIRRVGERRLQTVKTAGKQLSGLQQRQEWERVVESDVPVYELLPDEVTNLLSKKIFKAIQPLFTTDFVRTTWDVQLLDGSVIEVALDEGEIRSKQSMKPLYEVELELKAGDAASLYQFALQLQETVPLVIEKHSKAARGNALYHQIVPIARKAEALKLQANLTVEQVFIQLIQESLNHCQANEDVVLYGEDVEGVHQMRVALRRLRACLRLYKKLIPAETYAFLLPDLKATTAVLGVARDWDVFSHSLKQLPQESWLETVQRRTTHKQVAAYIAVRQWLRSAQYSRLWLQWGEWLTRRQWRDALSSAQQGKLEACLPRFVQRVLDKQYQRTVAHGESLLALSPAMRHAIRIETKKLAYGVRFFASLYPAQRMQTISQLLASLQTELGVLNDADVASRLLAELEYNQDHPAMCYLQGWYAHQTQVQLIAAEQVWQNLRSSRFEFGIE